MILASRPSSQQCCARIRRTGRESSTMSSKYSSRSRLIADGRKSKARTLIVHDPEDQFVPFVHARTAAQRVPKAQLRPFHLAGHIVWLGPDARAMHDTRVDFLRAP